MKKKQSTITIKYMKWLLISDTTDSLDELGSVLKENDQDYQVLNPGFSIENLQKLKSDFKEAASCFIYTKDNKDFDSRTAFIAGTVAGILCAEKVQVYTNFDFVYENSVYKDDLVFKFDTVKEAAAYTKKHFDDFAQKARKRIAINKLLDRGIPFTADCCATYIAKNKEEIFEDFIAAGIDVNSRDDLGTPLLNIAIRNDNEPFAEKLIALGADINAASTDRGYTAVMDAVWRGNEKLTEYLIKKGADLNTISKEGQSNLVLAVGADRVKICKLLVENGSDPDVKDSMGMSAYQYATLFKKEKIAEILKPFHKE